MIGALAAVELPATIKPVARESDAGADEGATYPLDPLREALFDDDQIEVPVYPWPHTRADSQPKRRLLRVSAQVYNEPSDYDRLVAALASRS